MKLFRLHQHPLFFAALSLYFYSHCGSNRSRSTDCRRAQKAKPFAWNSLIMRHNPTSFTCKGKMLWDWIRRQDEVNSGGWQQPAWCSTQHKEMVPCDVSPLMACCRRAGQGELVFSSKYSKSPEWMNLKNGNSSSPSWRDGFLHGFKSKRCLAETCLKWKHIQHFQRIVLDKHSWLALILIANEDFCLSHRLRS